MFLLLRETGNTLFHLFLMDFPVNGLSKYIKSHVGTVLETGGKYFKEHFKVAFLRTSGF